MDDEPAGHDPGDVDQTEDHKCAEKESHHHDRLSLTLFLSTVAGFCFDILSPATAPLFIESSEALKCFSKYFQQNKV